MNCQYCHKEAPPATKRTPHRWRRIDEEHISCPSCWQSRYIRRVVTMPVASPCGCSWEDLRAAIKPMWENTTHLSNWIMTELYSHDVRRKAGDTEMPSMKHVYLYPEARLRFPALPSQSVATIERTCQLKYKAIRYELVWTAAKSLPVFRYPVPFPTRNQSWSIAIENDAPVVSVRIGSAGYRLRVKTGPQFHRQFTMVRQLVAGTAKQCEMIIHQRGGALMVTMATWFPRQTPLSQGAEPSTLFVRTARDCLLIASNTKNQQQWRYNADHVRRWTAEHHRALQRWGEDSKYAHQPVPFAGRREAATRKFSDRMNSATHEIAAQVVSYASRRKFTSLQYDDTDKSYLPEFRWYRLAMLMKEKADAAGIQFITSATEKQEEAREPAPEECVV